MRKIYEKYFYVPEKGKGKIRERVFFARLAFSVVVIVFCMCAMGYNAYAYFTANIGSANNTLQATTYTLEIEPSLVVSGQGSVARDNAEEYKYTLQQGKYKFVLRKPASATASTGYCRIDVDETEIDGVVSSKATYYTQQIGTVAGLETPVLERTILIDVDKVTVICFTPCWGTYAGATTHTDTYLTDDKAIQLDSDAVALVDATTLQNTAATVSETPKADVAVTTQQETTQEETGQSTQDDAELQTQQTESETNGSTE